MDFKPINISYAGSLSSFSGEKLNKKTFFNKIKDMVWTYSNNESINKNTRSPYYLFKAVSELISENKISENDIRLNFWGLIDKKNIKQAEEFGLGKIVSIEGYISKQESLRKLKEADILFLPLESTYGDVKPLFIPGKVFDYIKLQKPILLLAQDSDCTDIVKKSGLGIIAAPINISDIKNTIVKIIADPTFLNNITPNTEYIISKSFKEKTKELSDIFNKLISK